MYPSAYSVPLNAFNEVWELEESDDLIASKSGTDTAQNANSAQINDATHRHYAVKTAIIRGSGTDPNDSSAWVIEDDEQDDDDDADDADDGYDDTDDDDADKDNADSALSNIQEEQDSTASPPHNSAQTARRQRASLLPSARRRRRPRQASSAATNQRPPFIQNTPPHALPRLAISSNDAPAPGPIELGMHVTYRYTAAAAEPAEPPPTGKDSSFWTSLRLGTIVGASQL